MSDISSEQATNTVSSSREEHFVQSVLHGMTQSKGFTARLRRADNPGTEYQSWDFLAKHEVNLEYEDQRLPFVTIAAALAKAKATANGQVTLGRAIAACYDKGNDSEHAKQASSRLRRLLACEELPELCRILRPLLALIASKSASSSLDFVRLLRQLRRFPFDPQAVRAQWAQEFYGKAADHTKQQEHPA